MTLFPSEYVDVALPVPIRHTFTYRVPTELRETARPGVRVLVPFGRGTREGVVVGFTDEPSLEPDAIKPVFDALDEEPFFDADLLELCRWVADYYLCAWGEVLHAATPAGFRVLVRRRVAPTDAATDEALAALQEQAPRRAELLAFLMERGPQTVDRLRTVFGGSSFYAPLARLESERLVRIEEERSRRAGPKRIRVARLAQSPAETADLLGRIRRRAPKQAAVLEHLARVDEAIPLAELARSTEANYGTIRALAGKGLLLIEESEEHRPAFGSGGVGLDVSPEPFVLNREQEEGLRPIVDAIDARRHETLLLYGVTGSGKTEVYMHAIREALDRGRSAIVLVPEIALTPQTYRRLVARFGDRVAVLHSRLSPGERYDEWRRIRRGDADIVVGPRSAIFAPVAHLGIVVIDEEHEPSYKQEEPNPRYHAREVAQRRAEQANAPLVLGSATPSLESLYAARVECYRLLRLRRRVENIALPKVEVVDMRKELAKGNTSIFSTSLQAKVAARLDIGEQVMLFLNRRGFSTYIFCRDCGHVETCRSCHISLTYHRRQGVLICHHCGHVRRPPDICRQCGSDRIRHLGLGTQQVEETTREAFPNARILRMDSDTTARKGSHERILRAFREGDADILVGTQMIAKGLDFPNVTLVGVILSETALYLPDFRASERAFHLLTQVAGRSGRSAKGGEVLFQTYQPSHYSIVAAQRHDYDAFCDQELPIRHRFGYPPFTHALRILIRGEDEREVIRLAHAVKERLDAEIERAFHAESVAVKGPAAAPRSRLRGQYRWHLLLCSERTDALRSLAGRLLEGDALPPLGNRTLILDMDPVNLV